MNYVGEDVCAGCRLQASGFRLQEVVGVRCALDSHFRGNDVSYTSVVRHTLVDFGVKEPFASDRIVQAPLLRSFRQDPRVHSVRCNKFAAFGGLQQKTTYAICVSRW